VSGKKRSGIGAKVVREKGSCARCCSRIGLHAHHMVAIADGGPDVESNIEVLCEECHREWHRDLEGRVTFKTFLDSIPIWFSCWMRENWDGHDVHSAWMMFRWCQLGGSFEVKGSGFQWLPSPRDAPSLLHASSPPVSPWRGQALPRLPSPGLTAPRRTSHSPLPSSVSPSRRRCLDRVPAGDLLEKRRTLMETWYDKLPEEIS
jgi:HNH endonuclease